jgi:AcrR family transcriptional regulator
MADASRTPTRTPDDPADAWRGRRRRKDHGTKREAVIRTAARAFDERGYHNTSLDDIAAALGVTKPTVYYYVPNKEQLLFECFRAGLEPIRAALRRADEADGTGRDRLRDVVRDYAVAIASEYGWCMVRAEDQDLGDELSDQVKALKSEIDRGIRRLLQIGMADGSIATLDPKLSAFAIAGALNWIAHWYRAGRSLTPEAIAEAFVGFLEHGLAPRPLAKPARETPRVRRKGRVPA